MSARYSYIILLIFLTVCTVTYAQEDGDGIPDNCEYRYGEHYRQNLFARYDRNNERLVLVDWTTGDEVNILATSLNDTLIQGWSADCGYLAVSTLNNGERDTVVYNTVTLERIGDVPGAHSAPHRIHWGPGEFLVVESRNGAVLWDVPRNLQYRYDTGFNTTTYRNFDRLRWDVENHQLIADLAVGGRRVYDLNTGTETISAASHPGMVALGGNLYPCSVYSDRFSGRRYSVPNIWLIYNGQAKVISFGLSSQYMPSIETLEADVDTIQVRTLSWSANCRYVAGALLTATATENSPARYDTVAWDVQNKRRIGVFEDAHRIPHPIVFDTAETHMLIQTRLGAYLWNLETDVKVLVNAVVEPPPFGCRYNCQPRSFDSVFWDAGRNQFLGVPVQEPDSIVAYDVNTGDEAERYRVEGESFERFITSNDSRYIAAQNGNRVYFWDRKTGARIQLDAIDYTRDILISPDSRYLVIATYRELLVWDIPTLADNTAPTYTLDLGRYNWNSSLFASSRTLTNNSTYAPQTFNIETGEITGLNPPFDPEAQTPIAFGGFPGQSGDGRGGITNWSRYRGVTASPSSSCHLAGYYNGVERKLYAHDVLSDDRILVAEDVNTINPPLISPDCGFIYGDESDFNTDVPYVADSGDHNESLGLWDINTGQKVYEFESDGVISWSPQGERGIIITHDGSYLIHPESGFSTPLSFLNDDGKGLSASTYWDYDRGMVYVSGCGAAHAFDMLTGEERLRLSMDATGSSGCRSYRGYYYRGSSFDVLGGGWIIVVGGNSTAFWNVDTLEHTFIPMWARKTYLSPDHRYVVMALSEVYVWDFQTAELVAEHGVSYSRVLSVDFVDNETIQVTRWNREATGRETALYDLATGMPLESSPTGHDG